MFQGDSQISDNDGQDEFEKDIRKTNGSGQIRALRIYMYNLQTFFFIIITV